MDLSFAQFLDSLPYPLKPATKNHLIEAENKVSQVSKGERISKNPKELKSLLDPINAFCSYALQCPDIDRIVTECVQFLKTTPLHSQEIRDILKEMKKQVELKNTQFDSGRSFEKHPQTKLFMLIVNNESWLPILSRAQVVQSNIGGSKTRGVYLYFPEPFPINIKGKTVNCPTLEKTLTQKIKQRKTRPPIVVDVADPSSPDFYDPNSINFDDFEMPFDYYDNSISFDLSTPF